MLGAQRWAIRQKATSAGAIWKVPQLMEALQNDFKTDMDLNDIKALYDFGTKLSDSSFIRLAITDQDLVDDYPPYSRGSCGALDAYALCPEDPTYQTWHAIFSHAFVDRRILQEHAPVQEGLQLCPEGDEVSAGLPEERHVGDVVRERPEPIGPSEHAFERQAGVHVARKEPARDHATLALALHLSFLVKAMARGEDAANPRLHAREAAHQQPRQARLVDQGGDRGMRTHSVARPGQCRQSPLSHGQGDAGRA